MPARATLRRAALAIVIAGAVVVIAYLRCRDRAPEVPTTPATMRGRARLEELRRQPPGSISGTVTAAGNPLASATVCARPRQEPAHPRCTVTDARGAYTIDALQPAAHVVWASAVGLAGGPWRGPAPDFDERVRVVAGKRTTGIDLVLLTGAVEVRGIVTDVRGNVIPAALIHVAPDSRSTPTFTTRSASDGSFVAWAIAGDIYVVTSADRYVDGESYGIAPAAKLEVVLMPESVLGGIVIEAGSRRPLDDATVEVYGSRARTDAGGKFRLTKLPPGRYKPTATSIGGYGEAAESLRLGLGESVEDLLIEVHPVAVVVGRVVISDGSTARPCPPDRGEVSLARYGSRAGYFARTTADGDILLEGVVPGSYQVTAACKGFLLQIPYPDLIVKDSDVEDLVWKVFPGARVAGHVVSRSGAPIADAAVNLTSSNSVTFAAASSAADGSFAAEGLAPGKTDVVASAAGFVRNSTPSSVVASLDSVAHLELVLDSGGSIAGDVVDEAGAPASLAVDARGADGGGFSWANAGGSFTIEALPPGAYDVSARTSWGDPPRGPLAVKAIVEAGKTTRVRLIAETSSGEITGTVSDPAGAPIPDAYVVAAREDESQPDEPSSRTREAWHDPPVLTALDGSFRITGLPRGRFSIRAYRQGGGEAVVEHVATGERARLTLRPTGVLAGVVVASDAASIDDVTISAIDRVHDISRDERLYRTRGRFALRDLPAGTYRVSVDGDPRSTITVTLAEGQHRDDLWLVAQPRFTIRGRLVSADGRPIHGWKVEAPRLERSETTPSGGRLVVTSSEFAITGPDGRFLIRDMPSGPTTISAGDVSRDADAKLAVIRELTLQDTTDVDLGDVVVTAP